MALFPPALAFTLRNEGSVYTDAEHDNGGKTKLGITEYTLSIWLGRTATEADIRALTPESVAPIYRALYWQKIGGDRIVSQPLATVVFDCSVLCGPARALRILSHARLGIPPVENESPYVANAFCNGYGNWLAMVAKNPHQRKWLAGWLTRVQHCRAILQNAV